MATQVACPSCSRTLRVPDELLGGAVQCPTCGTTFDAAIPPAPVSELPPLQLSLDDDEGRPAQSIPKVPAYRLVQLPPGPAPPPRPADARDAELRPCPFCRELIRRKVRRCPYCDEILRDADDRSEERLASLGVRRDCEPHRGRLILTLGIISLVSLAIVPPLGLVLGIIPWILGRRDIRKMRAGLMDPEGRGQTESGVACGVVSTILGGLCGVFLGGIIGFSLLEDIGRRRPRPTQPTAPWGPGPAPAPAPAPQ